MVIRGDPQDFVIACTESKSYQVKEVESSNTCILLSSPTGDSESPAMEALFSTNTYLELTEMVDPPLQTLQRLRDRLRALHPLDCYLGDGEDACSEGVEGLSMESLLDDIQLSVRELEQELSKYPTVRMDNSIHLLSEESRSRLLDEIVELCDDPARPLITIHRLQPEALKSCLPSSSSIRAETVIEQWFLAKLCAQNEDGSYAINESAFCRERLSHLLHPSRAIRDHTPLLQLEKTLDPLLPTGITFHPEHLRGLALLEENSVIGQVVRPLRVEDLPMEVGQRLERLFTLRQAWIREDMEVYVADFGHTPARVEELLLRNCRVVRGKDNERLFCKKVL